MAGGLEGAVVVAGAARKARAGSGHHEVGQARHRVERAPLRHRRALELGEEAAAGHHLCERGPEASEEARPGEGERRPAMRSAERHHRAESAPAIEGLQDVGRHEPTHRVADHVDALRGVDTRDALDRGGRAPRRDIQRLEASPEAQADHLSRQRPAEEVLEGQEAAAPAGEAVEQHDGPLRGIPPGISSLEEARKLRADCGTQQLEPVDDRLLRACRMRGKVRATPRCRWHRSC